MSLTFPPNQLEMVEYISPAH